MSIPHHNFPRTLPDHLRQLVHLRLSLHRYWPSFLLVLGLLILPAGFSVAYGPAAASAQGDTAPAFEVTAVVANQSATIQTSNFPANQTFTATMGPMGSKGIDGYVAGTISSGRGGTLEATFEIPAALHGSGQIAIRLASGGAFPYYAYNWFYNVTATAPPTSPSQPPPVDQIPVPAFTITKVTRDTSVSILTSNFPPQQHFTVTMGQFGTRGVGGISVGSLNSGNGGALTAAFNIPASLKGFDQIAIRAETSGFDPYFAYNWFYNVTTP